MILFVSDIHFGQEGLAEERRKEADLIACLRAHEETVERLYLVGDVFDEYIEYRHLVPKGYVRFQALLAEWTDRGVPVTYLVGNHDPWHRDYFARELGVRVLFDSLIEPLYGTNVYMAHGDGVAPSSRLYNRLRPLLRHPVPVALYRTLLPGDSGLALARWVNHHFGNEAIEEPVAAALRAHARQLLSATPVGVVVLGHSHLPELHGWPEGGYLNLGCWATSRTLGSLDADGLHLLQWNGSCAATVESYTIG